MRYSSAAGVMSCLCLFLSSCVSAPVVTSPKPTDGNPGSMYAWCNDEAMKRASGYTIRGRAYIDNYVRTCMLQNGAQPVVIIN